MFSNISLSVLCTSTYMSNEVQNMIGNIMSNHIGIVAKPFIMTSSVHTMPHSSFETKNESQLEDPIGRLQEFCVKQGMPLPTYDLQNTVPNPIQYHMMGKVGDIVSNGYGTLKKDAKKDAARGLLSKVKASGSEATYQELDDEIEEKLVIEFQQDK